MHNLNLEKINESTRIELNVTTLSNLTGIVAPSSSNIYTLRNVGTSNMAIPNENVNSDPQNRFSFSTTVIPNATIWIFYNTTISRWTRIQ